MQTCLNLLITDPPFNPGEVVNPGDNNNPEGTGELFRILHYELSTTLLRPPFPTIYQKFSQFIQKLPICLKMTSYSH